MSRLRAMAAAGLVAVVVFYALAAPLLRAWLGPAAVVPAYVAVAVLAGVATYRGILLLSRVAERTEDDEDLDGDVGADDLEDAVSDADLADEDVEEMLGALRAERDGEASPEREGEPAPRREGETAPGSDGEPTTERDGA